jgi:hypothetical protein
LLYVAGYGVASCELGSAIKKREELKLNDDDDRGFPAFGTACVFSQAFGLLRVLGWSDCNSRFSFDNGCWLALKRSTWPAKPQAMHEQQ